MGLATIWLSRVFMERLGICRGGLDWLEPRQCSSGIRKEGAWRGENTVRLGSFILLEEGGFVRGVGLVLMVSGWFLAVAALVLLGTTGLRLGFVAAALAVEGLGLGLVAQGYRAEQLPDAETSR